MKLWSGSVLVAVVVGLTSLASAAELGPLGDVPVLTFSDAHPWRSEMGGNWGVLLGPGEHMSTDPALRPQAWKALRWQNGDPHLVIRFRNLTPPHIFAGLWLSAFGHIGDRATVLPPEVAAQVQGVQFRARAGAGRRLRLKLEAKTADGQVRTEQEFELTDTWRAMEMPLDATGLKELVFVLESRRQPGAERGPLDGELALDDVRLVCGTGPWRAPADDQGLLAFAHDRGLRYFVWNYREPTPGRGVVGERNVSPDLISSAGMGYALAAMVGAEAQGILTPDEARRRVLAMLRWLEELDCESGRSGLRGFPYHFVKPDGSRAGQSEVSTIDWAICAAGIRVARQRYAGDPEVVPVATRLLARPRWADAVGERGLISHGFDGDGNLIPYDWDGGTEETYLTAVEAAAAGLEADVFGAMTVREVDGFWPSWVGAAFTYNWLQLWTGPWEPLAENSRRAYLRDAALGSELTGVPLMGYTACETFTTVDDQGFLKWDKYGGEIGSDVYLASPGSAKHWAVCPYGAALAAPFLPKVATTALREFERLGAAHPVLGFADSLRTEDVPDGAMAAIPGWTQFAIDVGPLWMALEASRPGGGRIARLYLADPAIPPALTRLASALPELPQERR